MPYSLDLQNDNVERNSTKEWGFRCNLTNNRLFSRHVLKIKKNKINLIEAEYYSWNWRPSEIDLSPSHPSVYLEEQRRNELFFISFSLLLLLLLPSSSFLCCKKNLNIRTSPLSPSPVHWCLSLPHKLLISYPLLVTELLFSLFFSSVFMFS